MGAMRGLWTGGGIALTATLALGGCGKIKPTEVTDTSKVRAAAHRQQAACGSAEAYDRLKSVLFDQAIAAQPSASAKLDTLADYSFVRMTNPVVAGSDPALEITRCHGRIVLEMPSAASTAFGGEHSLQADIDYTAQAAADGRGLVYQVRGAEPIVARLAAFDLRGGAYRPPPAIDEQGSASETPPPTVVADARPSGGSEALNRLAQSTRVTPQGGDGAPIRAAVPPRPALRVEQPVDAEGATRAGLPVVRGVVPFIQHRPPHEPIRDHVAITTDQPAPRDYGRREYRGDNGRDDRPGRIGGGEETVRAFYDALGSGDGETASAQIVPEKRGGRTYSPSAISRFYGRLPEPLRIQDIVPLTGGSYRVIYRYATGRSHCDGLAIVNLTNRGGDRLIRSIRALRDC